MRKTRIIKLKSNENEEMIMAITMIKVIIRVIIIIIIITIKMGIKIGNRIKTLKQNKASVQVKAIHISFEGENVEKAMFYWNTKVAKGKYQK